jgi:hypothetical protein
VERNPISSPIRQTPRSCLLMSCSASAAKQLSPKVKETLGHANIATTSGYLHARRGMAGVGMPQPVWANRNIDLGHRSSASHDVMNSALGEGAALAAHEYRIIGAGVARSESSALQSSISPTLGASREVE